MVFRSRFSNFDCIFHAFWLILDWFLKNFGVYIPKSSSHLAKYPKIFFEKIFLQPAGPHILLIINSKLWCMNKILASTFWYAGCNKQLNIGKTVVPNDGGKTFWHHKCKYWIDVFRLAGSRWIISIISSFAAKGWILFNLIQNQDFGRRKISIENGNFEAKI